MFFIFNHNVGRMLEKKRSMEQEIEVLKKQQKMECEEVLNNHNQKMLDLKDSTQAAIDDINAQIQSLKASINSVNASKVAQEKVFQEQLKVEMDKTTNKFDRKIVAKQNKVKRLARFIEAEEKNIQDAIHNTTTPNAPNNEAIKNVDTEKQNKKILLEKSTKTSKNKE